MLQAHEIMGIPTRGRGLTDITDSVAAFVHGSGVATGLLTVFIQHTSASLLIQENADSDVLADLDAFLGRLVREDPKLYHHNSEGPDDMPAHIRAALTQTHLSIPVIDGQLALGTWQAIYVFEHRTRPHRRHVVLHLSGTGFSSVS